MCTPPSAVPRLLAVGLVTVALACGGEQETAETPDAGGPVRRPDDERCLPASEAAHVLSPTALPMVTRIDHLAADETHVYFIASAGAGAALFRVSRDGGEATQLFADEASYAMPFALRPDHVLVSTSQAVVRVEKDDASARELAVLPAAAASDFFTGQQAFVFGDEAAYLADDLGNLHAVNLTTGASTMLATAESVPSRLVLGGDQLYWTEDVADPAASHVDALVGVSIRGGEPGRTELELGVATRVGFDLLAANSSAVFVDVRAVLMQDQVVGDEVLEAQGVYRAPLGGDTALKLTDAPLLNFTDFFGLPATEVVLDGEQAFVRKGTVENVTIFSVGPGDSESRRRLCVDLDMLDDVSTMAVRAGVLYLAVSSGEAAWIGKYDL